MVMTATQALLARASLRRLPWCNAVRKAPLKEA